jgi:hypothetical protein
MVAANEGEIVSELITARGSVAGQKNSTPEETVSLNV